MNLTRLSPALLWLLAIAAPSLFAHPVPRRTHDRIVTVRVTPEAVFVDYHLEVDEWTVVFEDLPAVNDKVNLKSLKKPAEFYDAFTRCYGPIFAGNITITLDGKELELKCVRHTHRVVDHLQCDFLFSAEWKLKPTVPHDIAVHDGNFELESGMLRLSLTNHPDVLLSTKTAPDEALMSRPASELKPGDDLRLRKAGARIMLDTAGPKSDLPPRLCVKGAPATPSAAGAARGK